MPYVSANQKANEAAERGFLKLGLVLLAVTGLQVLFFVTGTRLAAWLYPESETAQKTVRMMWRTLGWCIAVWAGVRIMMS